MYRKSITFSGGKFGERWHEIAHSLGINSHHHKTEWGESITSEIVLDEIKKHPKLKAICIQHCETSTGVMYPLNDILKAVKDYNQEILTFVDGYRNFNGAKAFLLYFVFGSVYTKLLVQITCRSADFHKVNMLMFKELSYCQWFILFYQKQIWFTFIQQKK